MIPSQVARGHTSLNCVKGVNIFKKTLKNNLIEFLEDFPFVIQCEYLKYYVVIYMAGIEPSSLRSDEYAMMHTRINL